LETAIITAYLNYLKAVGVLTVYEEKKHYIDYNLELSRVDQIMGDTGNVDIYRWQDEYYKVLREINDSRNNIRVARILLNLLMSQPGRTQFVLDGKLFSIDQFEMEYARLQPLLYFQQQAEEVEDFLVEQALNSNPRINRYDYDIEMQKKRLQKNFARYFPTIGFEASLGLQDRLEDDPPLFEEKAATWSLGAMVTLPLFSGADRVRERRVLNYGLSEIEYRKDDVRLDIIGRVRLDVLRFINRMNNLPGALESERQATAYVGMVMRRYSAGKVPLVTAADAIDNVERGRLTAINDRFEYFQAAASLLRNIGWSLKDTNRSPGMELITRINKRYRPAEGN